MGSSAFGDHVTGRRHSISFAFVKATCWEDLHLFMAGKLLLLFLLGRSGTSHPDHNGLSHLEALVNWGQSSRRRLACGRVAGRAESSFGPGVKVGSPREVPPGRQNAGLVHRGFNVACSHARVPAPLLDKLARSLISCRDGCKHQLNFVKGSLWGITSNKAGGLHQRDHADVRELAPPRC